jgi:hypothetical protein
MFGSGLFVSRRQQSAMPTVLPAKTVDSTQLLVTAMTNILHRLAVRPAVA